MSTMEHARCRVCPAPVLPLSASEAALAEPAPGARGKMASPLREFPGAGKRKAESKMASVDLYSVKGDVMVLGPNLAVLKPDS